MTQYNLSIFLLLFLLFPSFFCSITWSNPTLIDEENHQDYTFISEVYYDPITRVNHAIYADNNQHFYKHFAVSDDGKILYSTTFEKLKSAMVGSLVGPKNGKNLYLALRTYENSVGKVYFTESSDNGKTWSPLIKIAGGDRNFCLQDMLYIKETGRLVVFGVDDIKNQIRMVSRSSGSTIFSPEMYITDGIEGENMFASKSTYSVQNGVPILHLFYKTLTHKLAYISSKNNGVTWTEQKIINTEVVFIISNVIHDSEISNKLIVSYIPLDEDSAKLIISNDYGNTFSQPMKITDRPMNIVLSTYGLQIFGTREKPRLASLFSNEDDYAEFSIWDLENIKKTDEPNPFNDVKLGTEGIDIIADTQNSQYYISAFVAKIRSGKTQIYFSHGEGKY